MKKGTQRIEGDNEWGSGKWKVTHTTPQLSTLHFFLFVVFFYSLSPPFHSLILSFFTMTSISYKVTSPSAPAALSTSFIPR